MLAFETVLIDKDPQHPRIARLVLNRPDKLNAIGETHAFGDSTRGRMGRSRRRGACDRGQGAGRAFCAGYDLGDGAEGHGREGQGDLSLPARETPWTRCSTTPP